MKLSFGKKMAEIKCAVCGDKSHPTIDCPERKVQGGDIENEYHKFLNEINDPAFKNENPALMDEIKANDIRNSVLWTGKVNEPVKEETDNVNVEEKKEEEEEENEKEEETSLEEPRPPEEPMIKLDQSIPQNPLFNPNQRRVAPINPNSNVPMQNNYYHTYNNPYVFQNPAFNRMTTPNFYNPNIQHPLQRLLPLNNLGSQQPMTYNYPGMPSTLPNMPNMMKYMPSQKVVYPSQPMMFVPGNFMGYPGTVPPLNMNNIRVPYPPNQSNPLPPQQTINPPPEDDIKIEKA